MIFSAIFIAKILTSGWTVWLVSVGIMTS